VVEAREYSAARRAAQKVDVPEPLPRLKPLQRRTLVVTDDVVYADVSQPPDLDRDEDRGFKRQQEMSLQAQQMPVSIPGPFHALPPRRGKKQRVLSASDVEVAYWLYKDRFYRTEDRELDQRDVFALLTEVENRKRLKLEKAHSLLSMREQLDVTAKRQPIPQPVKIAVWQRDRGRCIECQSQTELEYDHVIPLSLGGSSTERNLQLLCAVCNRRKGATLG
jgi:hypothetical protein